MRILVNAIPLTNPPAGISRYIRSLYRTLEKTRGRDIVIRYFDGQRVLTEMPEGPANVQKWSRLSEAFWKLPPVVALCVRSLVFRRWEKRFRKVVNEFDLYHEAAFFPFKTPRHVTTVFTIHDLSLMANPKWHPKERALFFNIFFPKRLPLADQVLSVSEFTAQEMRRFLKNLDTPVDVTPLSCDKSVFFNRPEAEVNSVRARYGIKKEYFLFVGSGDPRKNFPTLSKAMEFMPQERCLVRVGWSGWDGGREDKARIIDTGHIPDEHLAALYSGAKALVYPSRYEGFGLPVLEAMSCGCPVICAHKASLPEVAEKAALYLHNPDDHRELVRLMARMDKDAKLKQKLVGLGLEQAEKFSWELTADKTLEAFHQAVQANSHAHSHNSQ